MLSTSHWALRERLLQLLVPMFLFLLLSHWWLLQL
jgi:hypothetical protein